MATKKPPASREQASPEDSVKAELRRLEERVRELEKRVFELEKEQGGTAL